MTKKRDRRAPKRTAEPPSSAPPSGRRGHRAATAAGLVVILALVAATRIRLLPTPLERDEGEYAYMAQLIRQGVAPYVEAYNMKLPGTYAAYAAFLTVFGEDAAAIRLGLLLTNLASIVLVFLLARMLEGEGAALAAAGAFAVLSLSPAVYGPFAHATHFVVLFALAGLLAVAHAMRGGRWWQFLGSGSLLGLSVLMKQNGAFFAALAFLFVAAHEWRARPLQPRLALQRLGLLSAGVMLPMAATLFILAHAGALERFWFWVVSYGQAYVSQVPLRQAWAHFRSTFMPVLEAGPFLWALAAAGLAFVSWRAWKQRRPGFILVFALVSAAAVCPGFWFRPHYYILFLPAAAFLVGAAAAAFGRLLAIPLGTAAPVLAGALPALACAQVLYSHGEVLFGSSPEQASRLVYPGNPFPETAEVGRYLRSHSEPAERIAVLGSEPQIYFYAARRAATGYLYTYPLMEPQPFARRMQDDMIREVERSPPAYIVFVNTTFSWLARKDSDLSIVDWATRFLKARYDLVGVVEIPEDGSESRYVWGAEAASFRSRVQNRLLVYRRKPAAGA